MVGGGTGAGAMSQPLRVAVVSHADKVWGAEHVLLRVARPLGDLGIEMRLCAPPGEFGRSWRALGLPVVETRFPRHQGLRDPDGHRAGIVQLAAESGAVTRSVVEVARLARTADVVHSNSLNAHLEVGLGARAARTPAVLHVHDLVAPGVGRRVLGLAARAAHTTIAISHAVAGCIGSGRVAVVANGVDARAFAPGSARPDLRRELGGVDGRPLVGVVGRLDPEKRIEMVIDAVAQLPADLDARLTVVGAPYRTGVEYERELRRHADARLPGRVTFVRPRPDMPDVIRCLDVLASAAVAEPFGLTLLEAQACGVPVVAVPAGGVTDFVADGDTGRLAATVPAFAEAITRVLSDGPGTRAMTARARRQVEAGYTVEQQALAIAHIYREAAGTAGAPADVTSTTAPARPTTWGTEQERTSWS